MKTIQKLMVPALVLLCGAPAWAQRSTTALVNDPAVDARDLYSWVQGNDLVIVADFIGLESPEQGTTPPTFGEDVLYEIHIVRGGSSLNDALTYQFRFSSAPVRHVDPSQMPPPTLPNTGGTEVLTSLTGTGAFSQTYTVTQLTNGANPVVVAANVKVPPPNLGPRTNQIVYAMSPGQTYENAFGDLSNAHGTVGTLTGGGTVFAGPRDDPHLSDDGAFNDLLMFRPLTAVAQSRNSTAYTNVHAIVLQIPLIVANGGTAVNATPGIAPQTVGVWASASRRAATIHRRSGVDQAVGPWRQMSRVGMPFTATWYIGVQDRDWWNRTSPQNDISIFAPYWLNPILARDAQALGFYGPSGPFAACSSNGGTDRTMNRVELITFNNLQNTQIMSIGDVLRVDLGVPQSGFPNGRLLTDRVADITMGLLLCGNAGMFASSSSGLVAPVNNEPEAPLPKGGGSPVFPYLQSPWDGFITSTRAAPSQN